MITLEQPFVNLTRKYDSENDDNDENDAKHRRNKGQAQAKKRASGRKTYHKKKGHCNVKKGEKKSDESNDDSTKQEAQEEQEQAAASQDEELIEKKNKHSDDETDVRDFELNIDNAQENDRPTGITKKIADTFISGSQMWNDEANETMTDEPPPRKKQRTSGQNIIWNCINTWEETSMVVHKDCVKDEIKWYKLPNGAKAKLDKKHQCFLLLEAHPQYTIASEEDETSKCVYPGLYVFTATKHLTAVYKVLAVRIWPGEHETPIDLQCLHIAGTGVGDIVPPHCLIDDAAFWRHDTHFS